MSKVVLRNLAGKKLAGVLCFVLVAGCLYLWLFMKQPKRESLQEKFAITDSILNSLVEKKTTFEEMTSRYGPPFRVYGKHEGKMVVFFGGTGVSVQKATECDGVPVKTHGGSAGLAGE